MKGCCRVFRVSGLRFSWLLQQKMGQHICYPGLERQLRRRKTRASSISTLFWFVRSRGTASSSGARARVCVCVRAPSSVQRGDLHLGFGVEVMLGASQKPKLLQAPKPQTPTRVSSFVHQVARTVIDKAIQALPGVANVAEHGLRGFVLQRELGEGGERTCNMHSAMSRPGVINSIVSSVSSILIERFTLKQPSTRLFGSMLLWGLTSRYSRK